MALLKLLLEGTLDEVKAFVKENPESVKEKDAETGRIALHEALRNQLDHIGKITFLLEENPMSASEKDCSESLPLHYAACQREDDDDDNDADEQNVLNVLRLLVKAFPFATRVRDSNDRLPLHCAIMAQDFDAATLLVQKHQGGLDATFASEGSLFRLALNYYAPDDFLRLLIERVPSCLQMKDDDGGLPLHFAAFHGASLDQIRIIVDAYPTALELQNRGGRLPLHAEATNEGRRDVLEFLLKKFPAGASICDPEGWMPIHCAVYYNTSIDLESLDLLHNHFPEGLDAVDCDGDSILHLACICCPVSISTVKWVLQKRPLSLRATNDHGALPLHILAKNKRNVVEILKILTTAFPGALQCQTVDAELPLHASVMGSVENLRFLLDKFPDGVGRANAEGELPLHVACGNENVAMTTVDLLAQRYPEGLAQYDKSGLLPIHHAASVQTLEHLVAMLKGSVLPASMDHTSALFVACERDAPLEVIMKLVEYSKDLFSGKVDTNNGDERRPGCAGNLRKKCKR